MAKKSQIQKFRDKARELEADESADKFGETLRRLAARKPAETAVKRKKRG